MSDEMMAELKALVETQRRELDALRTRVFELEGAQRAAAEPVAKAGQIEDARVSRRNLLGKAGIVAAAGVAGTVGVGSLLAQPAAAVSRGDSDPWLPGQDNTVVAGTEVSIKNNEDDYVFAVHDLGGGVPGKAFISAYSRNRASGKNMPAFRGDAESSYAFYGTSTNVPAVYGESTGSAGVQGTTTGDGPAGTIGASGPTNGVWGLSTSSNGVLGQSTSGAGVRAESSSSDAVRAVGGSGRGVYATSNAQPAVEATATSGRGVIGRSTSNYGVFGTSSSSIGVFASSSTNYGLFAQSSTGNGATTYSASKAGLVAEGQTYGATLQGGTAALKIIPQSTAGKPASGLHAWGELLCDKNGVLWFCTAGGSPGTWKKVTLA